MLDKPESVVFWLRCYLAISCSRTSKFVAEIEAAGADGRGEGVAAPGAG